jgi:hypothetical protein
LHFQFVASIIKKLIKSGKFYMFDRLRSKEAATISTMAVLSLGIAACGGQEVSTAPKEERQIITAHLGYCDGRDAIIERGAENIEDVSTKRYRNSPVCADGVLTHQELKSLAE